MSFINFVKKNNFPRDCNSLITCELLEEMNYVQYVNFKYTKTWKSRKTTVEFYYKYFYFDNLT